MRIDWGTPPNPRQGDPCTPYWGEGIEWGTPPSPRQGDPCTPLLGRGKYRIGGHPQTAGREHPAPLRFKNHPESSPPWPGGRGFGAEFGVAAVARFVYLAGFDRGSDGAIRFAQVRAIAEAAQAEVGAEFREGVGQVRGWDHPQPQLAQPRRVGHC